MNCFRNDRKHLTFLLLGNSSLVSKRNERVNASGSAGRDRAGQKRHQHEKQRHGQESYWIVRTYAEQQSRKLPHGHQRGKDSQHHPHPSQPHPLAHHQPEDVGAFRTHCHAYFPISRVC